MSLFADLFTDLFVAPFAGIPAETLAAMGYI